MGQDQKALLPFEAGTRRRRQHTNTLPFVDGQTVTMRLPQVGYLNKIILKIYLTGTATGATAFTGQALYAGVRALLNRVRVSTNTQAQIVSCSAWGLNLLSYVSAPFSFASDKLASELNAAPAGAGVWSAYVEVEIPIALNDGINYQLGLLNLQNDDISADLAIDWAAAASIWATPGNMGPITGTVTPTLVYYDVPDPSQYLQPELNHIMLVREQVDSITIGTGDHRYRIPRGNYIAQLIGHLTDNNVPLQPNYALNTAGKILNTTLLMQGATTDERVQAIVQIAENRRRYGFDLPAGTYVNDSLWDTDLPGRFELGYNLLDSAQYTELDMLYALSGVSANGSTLRTVTREIVRLAQ